MMFDWFPKYFLGIMAKQIGDKSCQSNFDKRLSDFGSIPSSIYSWSIGHILEHDFFCLGHLGCAGSKGKKVDLRNSEQLLRVVFSTF